MFRSYIHNRRTRYLALVLSVVFACTWVVPDAAESAFNGQINYQGKLTNASNVAVADGTYHMRFWLLTSPSAATSTAIWTEDRSTAAGNRVTVRSGLFSVMLGSSTPLTSVDFNQTLYLAVEVGGSGGSPSWDGEMSPRKVLGAVPAAFESDKVDGLDSTQFLRSDEPDTIASSSASTLLTITQNGTGDIVNVLDGAVEVFSILDGGNVGVGSTSPLAKFSVGGNAYIGGDLTATGTITFPSIVNGLLYANGSGVVSASTTLGAAILDSGVIFSSEIDTLAELETLQGGINIISSTEIDTYAELDALVGDAVLTHNGLFDTESEFEAIVGGTDFVTITTDDITSANLATALSNETGSGLVVFSDSPALTGTFSVNTNGLYVGGGGVGIGTTSPTADLSVSGSSGSVTTFQLDTPGNDSSNASVINLMTKSDGASGYTGENKGWILTARGDAYSTAAQQNDLSFRFWSGSGVVDSLVLDSATGNVGIGTTSPWKTLSVAGSASITGALFGNNGSAGTSGMVLQTTGSGFNWVATSSLNIGGITALGPTGQTSSGPTVTFATSSDTNIGLTITGSGNTQTFTPTWTGTLADARVADDLTISGGTLSSNSVAGTWTTTGTLTVGDGGDRIDIASNSWDVTNGTITGAVWNGTAVGTQYGGTGLNANPQAGELLIGNDGGFALGTLSEGSGISIFNDVGVIEISSTLGTSIDLASAEVTGTLGVANGGTGTTTFAAGGVVFASSTGALTQDLMFAWDDANNRLGIGTTTPTSLLSVGGNATIGGNLNATGTATIGTLSGVLYGTSGVVSASTTLGASALDSGVIFSSEIDTLAELETLQGGINIIASTEIDTESEFEAIVGGTDFVTITTDDITSANLATALSNETGSAGGGVAVFSVSPALTGTPTMTGFISSASSTIGGGTQQTGLTINGGATTTGNAYFGGRVGIGTTSPMSSLSIQGTTGIPHAPGTISAMMALKAGTGSVASDGAQWLQFIDELGVARMSFQSLSSGGNGYNVIESTNSASLQLTTPTLIVQNGGTNGGVLQLGGSGNGEIKTTGGASSYIAFSPNQTEVMRVTASGTVGIGTTTPKAPLHLNGASAIFGSLTSGTANPFTFAFASSTAWGASGANVTFDASNGIGSGSSGDFLFRTSATGGSGIAYPALNATSTTAGGSSTTTISWNHTVGSGNNRILLVHVFIGNNSAQTAMTVTYGGVAMTRLQNGTGLVRSQLWYLLSPTSGTASVVVTSDGTSLNLSGAAADFSGVSQTDTFGTITTGLFSTVLTTGATTTASENYSLVIDSFVKQNTGEIPSPQAHQTITSRFTGSNTYNATSYVQATTSLTTTEWSWSTNNRSGGYIAVAMRPSAISSPGVLSEVLRISNSGKVGIGSSTPYAKLSVTNTGSYPSFIVEDATSPDATQFIIDESGNVGIGTSSPTAQLHTSGTVRFAAFGAGNVQTDANGNLSVSSDERLKDVEGMFERGLADVLLIEPITYKWKESTGFDTQHSYTGFSAQNIQLAIPEAVGEDKRGYLTLSDRPILGAVINAIKELNTTLTLALERIGVLELKMQGMLTGSSTPQLTTDLLCVGATCVTESQLLEILEASGQTPYVPPAPVVPEPEPEALPPVEDAGTPEEEVPPQEPAPAEEVPPQEPEPLAETPPEPVAEEPAPAPEPEPTPEPTSSPEPSV